MRSIIIIIQISLSFWLACSGSGSVRRQMEQPSPRRQDAPRARAIEIITGNASYYGAEFHGKKTASGEIFDMNALTAAHPDLPFGTICKVTNLMNNREVVVRINDRGPFVGNRIIDLSYGAAKELDGVITGVMEVKVEVLKYGNQ